MGHTSSSISSKVKDCDFAAAGEFHELYQLGRKLGKGAFAQVYLCVRADDEGVSRKSAEKAVKIIDLRDKGEKEDVRKLQKAAYQEANLWSTIGKHTNVVRMYETFYDNDFCYMVMEKCACGLYQYLERTAEFNERFIGELLVQMLVGTAHVHSVRILHRDIKPDNFLVGGENGQVVKLGDFGLSQALPPDGRVTGVFGTAPFMAPEMVKGRSYDTKADVWSLGVLAYAFFYGNFPYVPKVASSKAMKQAIIDGAPPLYDAPGDFSGQFRSDTAVNFIQTLLEPDPESRPTAEEALNLTYMEASFAKVHMSGKSLPSLRPMLRCAKKSGAFDVRDLNKENDADVLLQKLQTEKHGGRDGLQTELSASSVHTLKAPSKKTKMLTSSRSNVSGSSNAWDNASSVKSGMWKTACSAKSNAWGEASSVNSLMNSSRSTKAPSSSRSDAKSAAFARSAAWTPLNSLQR